MTVKAWRFARRFTSRSAAFGEVRETVSAATIMQQKTQRPAQFEITEQSRESVAVWIRHAGLHAADFLFTSRIHDSPYLWTRPYARLVHRWVASIGLDDTAYGTHTLRRTKASLIYRRTKNLRAVQLLLEPASAVAETPPAFLRSLMVRRSKGGLTLRLRN